MFNIQMFNIQMFNIQMFNILHWLIIYASFETEIHFCFKASINNQWITHKNIKHLQAARKSSECFASSIYGKAGWSVSSL